jgi:ankyrin repeat protein
VSILLAAKADPNITTEGGETALHWASAKGEVEIVNLLVKHGAAVDIRNKVDIYCTDRERAHAHQVGQKEYRQRMIVSEVVMLYEYRMAAVGG